MNTQIYKDTANPFWNAKISLVFFLVVSFVIVSTIALSGITNNLDNSITAYFDTIQNETLDLILIIITTTSDTINLIIAGFVLTIIKRTRRFGMILLISLVAITILVTYIKPLFGVEHPQETFVPLVSLPEKFTLERDSFMPLAQGYSYPSNHIASAAAFGFIIGGLSYRYSYKFGLAFMISFPVLIGFTKLYLFQHNLMDLIGGYLFGLIVAVLIVKGLKANTQTLKNSGESQDANVTKEEEEEVGQDEEEYVKEVKEEEEQVGQDTKVIRGLNEGQQDRKLVEGERQKLKREVKDKATRATIISKNEKKEDIDKSYKQNQV